MGAFLEDLVNKYIYDFSKKSVGPTYDLKGTEAFSKIFGSYDNFSEEHVSERRAQGLATVYTCINVKSQTIGALPINPMREKNGKKEVLTDHPSYYPIAQQANNYMSSANLFMTSQIHSDTHGNSVIGINRDGFGRPVSFEIIDPNEWNVTTANGKAFYKINGETYSSRDVLHFRWYSQDGLIGISPIRQNAMTMGKAIKSERYSAMTMGKNPPGILSYEGDLRPEQKDQNKKSWKEDLEQGKTPVLSGRWTYQPIIIPPGEAQYIETEGMTDQKICGIFRVPPVFTQNYERATWKNAEESDLIFAKHTITPIVRVIEQELNMKLFTEKEKKDHFFKFNLNGLLRADTETRGKFYTMMRNIGGMNGNEIRDKEDMNSYEGGEIFTVQGANVPVEQLRDFYSGKMKPSADENIQKDRMNGVSMTGHLKDYFN